MKMVRQTARPFPKLQQWFLIAFHPKFHFMPEHIMFHTELNSFFKNPIGGRRDLIQIADLMYEKCAQNPHSVLKILKDIHNRIWLN